LPLKAPVPRIVEEWVRKSTRTLNDAVESYHIKLLGDPEYCRFLDATVDSEAVEGSLSADNYRAADALKKSALAAGDDFVGKSNLASITKALSVVLKYYNMSRKQRRNMIGGKSVPGDDNNE